MSGGIPVTILSGPLGAGKTTVLNHLLQHSGDRSIAVLVNDMGDLNVDAQLVAAGSDLADEGRVAELSNGCICCELQDDLETEVARLAADRTFDSLVVESSGISEPEPVARLFTTSSRAAAAYELDTLVTVVDADRFVRTFGDQDRIERETAPGSEDRPLSDLLIEQIEFANVVLLNKCDLVEDAALDRAEELIGTLAPAATVIRTVHGRVDPDAILGTERFDLETMAELAGWQQALAAPAEADHDHDHTEGPHHHDDDHSHAHPDAVYGVTSFTYRRRRPFHPERFRALLADLPRGVVRMKGQVWVAGRPETALLVSQAGRSVRVSVLGPWLASLPEVERDLYRGSRPDIEWDDDHGDRLTALVVIGQDFDDGDVVAALDDCLVTDDEWDAPIDATAFPSIEDAEAVLEITAE